MDITLKIDNRVHVCGQLPPDVVQAIKAEFTYPNPEYAKAKVFGFKRRVPQYVCTWRAPNAHAGAAAILAKEGMAHRCAMDELVSIPRGGLPRLGQVFVDHGLGAITYRYEDARSFGQQVQFGAHRLEARAYQRRLVEAAEVALAKPAGLALWRSPQASGKTTATLMLIPKLGVKTLVVVSNSVLFEQWQRRCARELGVAAGQIGGGKYSVDAPIVIAMQQSLKNVPDEVLDQFGFLVCDEIQLFAAPTFEASVDRCRAAYRLGVSGDERRADRKEFYIYDQFGPVVAEVKHAELVQAGDIHEVEVRVVFSDFDCEWWHKIEGMQRQQGESEQGLRMRRVQMKIQLMERLFAEMDKDSARNQLVVQLAQEAVAEAGNAIVLTTRREHCHTLDSALQGLGLRSGLLIGGSDYKEEFGRTLARFEAREADVAVGTYQAIGVGFDMPIVARGICAAPAANSEGGDKQWRQYRGRFARTADGKADAAIVYILDRKVYGLKPMRHLVRWNNRVVVRIGGAWVPAKEWLAKERKRDDGKETQRRHNEQFGFGQWDPVAQRGSGGAAGASQATREPTTQGGGLGNRPKRSEVASLPTTGEAEGTGAVRARRKRTEI